jgi:hypothetical protein
MQRLALLLCLVALPLAIAATAAANSTQSQIVTFHETNPFGPATVACGFPIDLRTDGSFEITDYYDNSGTLFKEIVHNHGGPFTVTAINPANGKSTTTRSQTVVEITYFNPDGSIVSESGSGLSFNFHVAGLGTILQVTGRLVRDGDGNVVFEAGPHDFHDQNTDAFCSYMADP